MSDQEVAKDAAINTIDTAALLAKLEEMNAKIEALAKDNEATKEENKLLAFEARNNQVIPAGSSRVYQGRPDSARHVTIATRPVQDQPELFHAPTAPVRTNKGG